MGQLAVSDLTTQEIARFQSRIQHGPGCWIWDGEVNRHGYGYFAVYRNRRRVRFLSHRLALTLKLGREPNGVTRHTCDNPPCCRDDHLLEGSRSENNLDAVARGRHPGAWPQAAHAARVERARNRIAARIASGVKRCARCKIVKPLREFGPYRKAADGCQSYCRSCMNAYSRSRSERRPA